MIELLTESLSLVNLPFTFLMVTVVVYWLLMIVGVVALDSLDMDSGGLDLDVDGDVDLGDIGGDADLAGGPASGIAAGVLSFVNADRVPLAIVLSFFFLFLWVGMIFGNHLFNPGKSILIGVVILVPVYIAGVLLTKACTWPFAKFFSHLKSGGDENVEMIGRECRLLNNLEGDRLGQVEIMTEGAPYRLNVRSFGGEKIAAESEVVIVAHKQAESFYLVKAIALPVDD